MKKLIAVAVIVPMIVGAMTSGAASCDCWAVGASMGQDKRCRVSCERGMVAVCKDGKGPRMADTTLRRAADASKPGSSAFPGFNGFFPRLSPL